MNEINDTYKINQNVELWFGDCISLMTRLSDNSIDMVLCDLPYGCLNKKNPNAKWDCVLPFDELWKEYKRITKPNSAIVLFASGLFTSKLIMSNPSMWKYNWIWKKGNRPTGFLNSKKQPLRITEDICVFYEKQPVYNPQFTIGEPCHSRGRLDDRSLNNNCYGVYEKTPTVIMNQKYPLNIIDCPKEHPQRYHPTQKPVALCEYLVQTYTNEGDIVLDNCCGSGTTGIACINTGRKFIGIECDEKYFKTAMERLNDRIGNTG